MPGQGRLGDKASVPLDAHGCPACPHPAIGPAIQGSPDVNVNKRPALRVDDSGIHAACCGTNTWAATEGSQTVFINGKAAHRMGDQNRHCGGTGQLVEGSPNVMVGESGSGGGRGGTSGPSSSSSGGSSGTNTGGDGSSGNSDGRSAAGNSAGSTTSRDASSVTQPASFVELVLVDQDDQPLGGQRYRIVASDGAVCEGALDDRGRARIDGVAPGNCQVAFPDLAFDGRGPA